MGERGCEAVADLVPRLRGELGLDAVIANGENSAGGRGITAETGARLLSVADFLTLGDHAFDQQGTGEYLAREGRVIRPENLGEVPGRGWGTFEAGGACVGVANVQGRVFMQELRGSPFEAADLALDYLAESGAEVVLVDVHAEATSEKQAMGYYLEGRAQAVIGTHTHVATTDARILPGGTAYLTDVGMVGDPAGIIGMDRARFMDVFLEGAPLEGGPAEGNIGLNAVLVEIDVEARRATSVERVDREWTG